MTNGSRSYTRVVEEEARGRAGRSLEAFSRGGTADAAERLLDPAFVRLIGQAMPWDEPVGLLSQLPAQTIRTASGDGRNQAGERSCGCEDRDGEASAFWNVRRRSHPERFLLLSARFAHQARR